MVLYVVILIFIVSPFFPATENPHWFFRTPDFIRLQSVTIQMVLLALFLIFENYFTLFSWILLAALVGSIIYQVVKVFPYSSLYPRNKPDFPSDGCVSILAGNVLQDNTQYNLLKTEIKQYNPDLVLTMESDIKWEEGLSEIEKVYPYTVKIPLDNYYGMHLYSKTDLINVEVNYHVEEGVPSIFFEYPLSENQTIFFACLHPAPPSPTENETSKERDAELMIVGKIIRKLNKPVVICGDMNDVVWSRTTRLFKKMTAMIDPRIGRGFFPTYHAKYRLMRFPLDHLFHTKDLFVKTMVRTKNFGSDHFAMYYEIHHKKRRKTETKGKLNGDEEKEVEEKIEEGK
ncbi:endonuclease/exonuclease/phosphatase family protein [Marixanthomonas ophiurae]|uniref:Endonuclease/exonuclease/phosphatase family protein n=1 Tax=Marixanthomonas ophiurae TaxID=387659 RepID=A0A3E1Q9N4_9FLAO|nr:endonuclease/exonuclease/phosphatase family protein [Marixanthomonas ophiurae]RFN58845.1 endonuclease/exonuclease/phosphatase family protein [Marixanthomonas ophiurae]